MTERERMDTEARREQLLDAGVELLRHRPHADVSTEDIAAAAGVSKGLLYHYFPTKQDFIVAALERGQRELAATVAPNPDLPPIERLDASLDAFLEFVAAHPAAFAAIFRAESTHPRVAAVVEAGRAEQLETMLAAVQEWHDAPVSTARTPELEAALEGWLHFVQGTVLRWMEHGGFERSQLRVLLRAALGGAVLAAAAARGEGRVAEHSRDL